MLTRREWEEVDNDDAVIDAVADVATEDEYTLEVSCDPLREGAEERECVEWEPSGAAGRCCEPLLIELRPSGLRTMSTSVAGRTGPRPKEVTSGAS